MPVGSIFLCETLHGLDIGHCLWRKEDKCITAITANWISHSSCSYNVYKTSLSTHQLRGQLSASLWHSNNIYSCVLEDIQLLIEWNKRFRICTYYMYIYIIISRYLKGKMETLLLYHRQSASLASGSCNFQSRRHWSGIRKSYRRRKLRPRQRRAWPCGDACSVVLWQIAPPKEQL
jgi:hypothetical protein